VLLGISDTIRMGVLFGVLAVLFVVLEHPDTSEKTANAAKKTVETLLYLLICIIRPFQLLKPRINTDLNDQFLN
jgi:hypothetical protein